MLHAVCVGVQQILPDFRQDGRIVVHPQVTVISTVGDGSLPGEDHAPVPKQVPIALKDMATGEQLTLTVDEVIARLK